MGFIIERAFALGAIDDALVALAEAPLLHEIAEYLAGIPTLRGWIILGGGSPDLLRGWITLRLGNLDEAAAHFQTGLAWAEREGLILIAGRCELALADVAERRGDHAAAAEHLDRAGDSFVRHGGAQLYLDQVLAKKEILKA